jgi:octaprenyl-diphosphate synthase
MRPVLVLLSAGACGGIRDCHLYLSAAIELIHAASLLHDDVIDNAEIRRHLPTVNATWGNRTSVLLGDFLYTRAFYVASLANNVQAIKEISRSSNRVCEGEIRQNAAEGNFALSESEYLSLISDKTGELCRCSCMVGALVAGADQKRCAAFGDYGLKLGVAFQIIDDVLDLVGHQNRVGKTLGTDVANQKATLPILHSLRVSAPDQRSALLEMLNSRPVIIEKVVDLLNSTGSIEYATSVAQAHLRDVLNFSQKLSASPYALALENLAHFVLNRTH